MKNSAKNQLIVFFLLFQFYSINAQDKLDTPYGNNDTAGKYVELNGAKIYYEEYGNGEPLLLIHGNGANIKSMENQIEYFKSKYRVIIADNRGHGKSELKTDSLTYTQITKDWDGLVNYLKLDSINILGWSDGGIIALKMGISKQSKIKKIIAMAANLRPDTTAVHSWAPNGVMKSEILAKKMIAKGDTSRDWKLKLQHYGLLLNQPNISHDDLKKITVPVLIVAGDRDIIKNEHSVEIFEQLSKGQLCIMAGSTHVAPKTKPEMFNEIVNRFLTESFDYKPRK
ncbi:alpha/beta hydrolase [Gelidibacter japonicus]|uniref:alpha/beta fold hydrolase n=1 Tax=Gelidibacter japonicus TaxID=1962232 RepID=UPI002020CBEE|nr:alpha/beta hydrolase [Gelidibacter japonicus]MCL8008956.1 alpha/beta hydrolase [Gelidibacter japonicus]